MLMLVIVCSPAKVLIFYSGHPDVCTAIIREADMSMKSSLDSDFRQLLGLFENPVLYLFICFIHCTYIHCFSYHFAFAY